MSNPLLNNLLLLDTSGYVIIFTILLLLASGIFVTVTARARYDAIGRDLERHARERAPFRQPVLARIARDFDDARERHGGEVNTQAIIDNAFQSELKGLLIGERFVKSLTGLLIIFGLVGTFYGLTSSIGRLVTLVSGDGAGATDVTESLTRGLKQALSGMSVAFSCSLVGILAAILITLLGVFASITDRRNAIMVEIEAHLDHLAHGAGDGERAAMSAPRGVPAGVPSQRLESALSAFGQSVGRLEQTVAVFEEALQKFGANTRDFQEFNLHLKDNIQRMSLSFGDLGEALKSHAGVLSNNGGPPGRSPR